MIENQYLSFYIFYGEPWEPLLVKAIHPLMKKLLKDGLISQYFFIRYWERGPHIRLRLKKVNEIDEVELSATVLKELNSYVVKNPSKLLMTPGMEARQAAESWNANNQIVKIKYKPETSRYGGVEGLLLAELQFFASSRVVINEVLEASDWSYDQALGAAIKWHVGFVFSLGITTDKIADFFEQNCRDWLPRAVGDKNSKEQQEKILSQFTNAYTAQKTTVLPYIQGIWEQLQENPTGSSDPVWENWLTINSAVYTNLQLLENTGLLTPADTRSGEIYPTASKLWNILSDFVHLTNNRLGVMNRDEGFLAFMLAQAFRNGQ